MMKPVSRMLWTLLLAGSLLSLGLLYVIGLETSQRVNGEVYMVISKSQGNTAEDFTEKEIRALQKNYEEAAISYESFIDETVQNMGKSAALQVVATNGEDIRTCGVHMKQGSFFLEENLSEKQIVLDERAAFLLWGTTDCLGETLEVQGDQCKIIGIAESETDDEEIGYKMVYDKLINCTRNNHKSIDDKNMDQSRIGKIYRLGSTLASPPPIHWLYIRFDEALKSKNEGMIKEMLRQLGRKDSDYQVVDLTGYRRQIQEMGKKLGRGYLLLLLISLLWQAMSQIRKQYRCLKEVSIKGYISDYIKAHWFKIIGLGALDLAAVSGVIFVIRSMTYLEIQAFYEQQAFPEEAYKLPEAILELQRAEAVSKGICIVGGILGMLIAGYGLNALRRRESKKEAKDITL